MTPDEALEIVTQFGIRRLEPGDSDYGPRIRVNGDVVNELRDGEGFYAVIELPRPEQAERVDDPGAFPRKDR